MLAMPSGLIRFAGGVINNRITCVCSFKETAPQPGLFLSLSRIAQQCLVTCCNQLLAQWKIGALLNADCDISAVSGSLQVPWALDKSTTFAYWATYMGFYWDLSSYPVGIPADKSAKYRAAIAAFLQCCTHNLEQVQVLFGKVLHCTHIVPCGHAYLTSLERTMALPTTKPFQPVRPA